MGNFPLIGSFLSSRLASGKPALLWSSIRTMGSSIHIWKTPARKVPGLCTHPVLSCVTKTVPPLACLRRMRCYNRTGDPTPWFVITFSSTKASWLIVWSGHSRWMFSCSLYIPCLTSACFTYTLLTWLTFLLTGPSPQLVIVLIKGVVRGVPLCWFPW